eukprot:7769237-Alexandrium_andersonii.AAC.1
MSGKATFCQVIRNKTQHHALHPTGDTPGRPAPFQSLGGCATGGSSRRWECRVTQEFGLHPTGRSAGADS